MQTKLILIAAGALASLACSSGGPVNIGENTPSKTGEQLSDYAATWDGYVEAYRFHSGSDRVRLTLDENGVGWLEVGDVELAPPVDPEVGYGDLSQAQPWGDPFWVQEGFRYAVNPAELDGDRLQVEVQNYEAFTEWCALQTPVELTDRPGTYSCWDHRRSQRSGDACYEEVAPDLMVPVDCGKVVLCGFVCSCTAESCTVASKPAYATRLDGTLENDGDSLVGTLLIRSLVDGQDTERLTVRLERQ
jgi:hypothetical protein